jgi:hypothetical protein
VAEPPLSPAEQVFDTKVRAARATYDAAIAAAWQAYLASDRKGVPIYNSAIKAAEGTWTDTLKTLQCELAEAEAATKETDRG